MEESVCEQEVEHEQHCIEELCFGSSDVTELRRVPETRVMRASGVVY